MSFKECGVHPRDFPGSVTPCSGETFSGDEGEELGWAKVSPSRKWLAGKWTSSRRESLLLYRHYEVARQSGGYTAGDINRIVSKTGVQKRTEQVLVYPRTHVPMSSLSMG